MRVLFILVLIAIVYFVQAKEKVEINPKLNKNIDGPVIGIDLGTTYSVVSIYRNGSTEVFANELGSRIVPSVVSWNENGERLIGEAAKNNAIANPKNTLYDVKRLIGRRYSEVLQKDAKLFSYDLANKDGRVYVKVQRKPDAEPEYLSPEEVSAMILTKMKQIAETALGQTVKYAVITVPAYFNDQQRQATADAGKIAGLEVLRILNEPTAASMAYGLHQKKEQNVLVFDLGGGTFDVSLLNIEDGVFEVIATSGDTHLGGEDFDLRVVEHFAKMIKQKHGKEVRDNKSAFQKLKLAAERAKRELSYNHETRIEIESLLDGVDFSEKLTRAKFEELNMDLFKGTLIPVKQVLDDAKMSKKDIDEVVLVGGSTRIPKVQELLSKFFDGKELNKKVDPDEAVGAGAAVQAAVLAGTMKEKDVILIDVTPLSLGIETQGGVMATIIPRNTHIPADKADIFTTTEDYQDRLVIPIYEGERRLSKHNRLLGELELSGIPAAPRGVPQIRVQFQLDSNGILKVIATDMGTQNKKEITINKKTLTDEEIKRMQADAEQHAEEDKAILQREEARQKLERYISDVSSQLNNKNVANRIKSKDQQKIIGYLKEKNKWLNSARSENAAVSEYKKRLKELKKAIGPIFSQLYGGSTQGVLGDDDDDDDEDDAADATGETKSDDDKPISDDDKPISEMEKKDEKVEEKKDPAKKDEL